MTPLVTMRTALADPDLLGSAMPDASWAAWKVILIGTVGEELTPAERKVWRRFTGRAREPGIAAEEAVWVAGRRSGKSKALAVLASYFAGLVEHGLPRGERALASLTAVDQRQAAVVLSYIRAIFERSPLLRSLVIGDTAEGLRLSNGIDVEVRPASFRAVRGATAVFAALDEAAFLPSEGAASPDSELLTALRPCLASTGGMLVVSSSPYAKRGELYQLFTKHYGPRGDRRVPVVKGASRELNPSLSQSVIRRALERDPVGARSEYLAEWRDDVSTFLRREAVAACVASGLIERPPERGILYRAFTDPSGGSADSFGLAIGHRDGDAVVVDALREFRPPFSPEAVVEELSALLKSYGVREVTGDRYAGEWPRERFRRAGIGYVLAPEPASGLFLSLVATINGGRIALPDNDRLVSQLCALERRVSRGGGRDVIGHPAHAGAHDDIAVCVAGLSFLLTQRPERRLALAGPQFIRGGFDDELTSGDDLFDHPNSRPADVIFGRALAGALQ